MTQPSHPSGFGSESLSLRRWLVGALWTLTGTLAALVITLAGAWASNAEARLKAMELQQTTNRERLASVEAAVKTFTEAAVALRAELRDLKRDQTDRDKALQARVDQILQELRRREGPEERPIP